LFLLLLHSVLEEIDVLFQLLLLLLLCSIRKGTGGQGEEEEGEEPAEFGKVEEEEEGEEEEVGCEKRGDGGKSHAAVKNRGARSGNKLEQQQQLLGGEKKQQQHQEGCGEYTRMEEGFDEREGRSTERGLRVQRR
jgi:hypothetical protein